MNRKGWTLAFLLTMPWAPRAEAVLNPSGQQHLDEGLTALYNLDYEQCRSSFRKIIEDDPDNPFGYLAEAGAIWWQASMEYGLFKDTPTLQGLFEQDIEAAIRKADPLQSSHDKGVRADGHFIEGMARGTLGQWQMLRGHWVKAYFEGKHAMKHLRKCVKLDEEYYDADLGLGVFDYQAAHFRGILKLSELVGIHGDEQRGLERMQLAMEKGRFAQRQAAEFLVSIYVDDLHDYRKALPILLKLRSDFPSSLYFQFVELIVRFNLGDWDGSLKVGREIAAHAKADPKGFNRKLLSISCGLTGEKCLDSSNVELAAQWFTRALAAADAPRSKGARPRRAAEDLAWQTLNHLYRGYAEDILGRTDQAEADYRWVLAHRDFSDSHARAKECLEKSCDAKQILQYMRALSRGEAWASPAFGADSRP